MKFLPDPANQIELVSACVKTKPRNEHLKKPDSFFTVLYPFSLQDQMIEMFK